MGGIHLRFFQLTLIALIAALLLSGAGIAEGLHEEMANPNLALEVTVGYDGMMTYGKTMPISVHIENAGADLHGRVAVNTYENPTRYNRYEMDLELASGAAKEVVLPVRVNSRQDTYTVEVWQGDEKLCAVNAAPAQIVNPYTMLIGALSPEPQNLSYMNISMETDELMRGQYIQIVPLTEATFPENIEALDSFGAIAVDGFDAGALNERQNEALRAWLEDGGILILGGGAQAGVAWPHFSEYTGILPGEIARHADVTPALLNWLGVQGAPLGGETTLASATGGRALVEDSGTPLIWRASAGSGVVYTAAFELGDRALAAWEPMHSFWQRLMIQDCYALYQNCYNNSYEYDDLAYNSKLIPLENDAGLRGAAAIVAALLIAGGAVAYLLLKRMDRRQLMWLVLPMLAAAGTAAVCLIAMNGAAARPTALSVSVLSQDEAGERALSTSLAVATPDRKEALISVAEGELSPSDDGNYYYDYGKEDAPTEPTELNYRYVLGENGGIGLRFDAPWSVKYFRINDLTPPEGEVETSLWMEDDGLHGRIANQTAMKLSEGVFLCRYGYCSVPALEPGESCELTLRRATFANLSSQVYEDGCMYGSLSSIYVDTYSMLNEYFFHASQPNADFNDPEKQLRMNLASGIIDRQYRDSSYNYSYYAPKFHYLAFTDALEGARVQMDRTQVERSASLGVVIVNMTFDSVDATGRICRIPGMDAARLCTVDAGGAPIYDPEAKALDGEYHRLIDQPTFAFEVAGAAGAAIDRLAVYCQSMPTGARMFLYDGESWVECAPGGDVASPERFVDDLGRVYVQFRTGSGFEEYEEIFTPSLLLEGRVR